MVRKEKGLSAIDEILDYKAYKEREYDRLADIVREGTDIKKIYEIMKGYHD